MTSRNLVRTRFRDHDYPAYFIADTVDHLDLSSITDSEIYRVSGSGNPPYHPAMMLELLIYAYCSGVFASRRIAKRIHEDVAFRGLTGGLGG